MKEENNKSVELSEEEKKKINEKHNKQLKWTFIIVAFLFITVGIFYLVYNATTQFEYAGVNFKKVRFGELIFYQVSFPLYSQATGEYINDYNFFVRKDPRTLKDIPINGSLDLSQKMILNADEDLFCKDNGIAMANFAQFFKNIGGVDIIANNSLKCNSSDTSGAVYVKLQNGTENRIDKIGNNCYELTIKDCQILDVTERFIVGTLAYSKNQVS